MVQGAQHRTGQPTVNRYGLQLRVCAFLEDSDLSRHRPSPGRVIERKTTGCRRAGMPAFTSTFVPVYDSWTLLGKYKEKAHVQKDTL